MLATTTNVAEPAVQTWRVVVSNRADVVFALRDYFRRLGFDAALEGPTVVRVHANVPDDEVADYVRSWARINGIDLSLEPVTQSPAIEASAVAPVSRPVGSPPLRLGELLIQKG